MISKCSESIDSHVAAPIRLSGFESLSAGFLPDSPCKMHMQIAHEALVKIKALVVKGSEKSPEVVDSAVLINMP